MEKKVRLGEKNVMNCGMSATIINYKNNRDIDIKFDDGTIVEHKAYRSFKTGTIAHPSTKNSATRLGMVREMFNGQLAQIIAYRASDDIDVQFEDGTIVTNTRYSNFMSGHIAAKGGKKSKKAPQSSKTRKAKAVKQQKKKKAGNNLKTEAAVEPVVNTTKKIVLPEEAFTERIGMTRLMDNGKLATIIKCRNDDDIDVMFEDGAVVTNERFYSFMTGKIVNPNIISAQPQISEAETSESSEDNDLLPEISDKAEVLEVSDSSTDTVDSSDISESFDDSKLLKDDITGFSSENDSSDKVLDNFTFEDLKDIPETELNKESSLKEIAINPTFLYDLLTNKTKSNTTNPGKREPEESIPKNVDIREDVPYNTNHSKLSNDIIFGKYDKILGIKNNPIKKGEIIPLSTDERPVAPKENEKYSDNRKDLETTTDDTFVNAEESVKETTSKSEEEKTMIYNCQVTDAFMTLMEYKTGACCPDLYYIFSFEGQKDCSVVLTARELASLIYMDIVTVDKDDICLEDITSKYVRLECTSDKVKRIGHIFHDKWVEIKIGAQSFSSTK